MRKVIITEEQAQYYEKAKDVINEDISEDTRQHKRKPLERKVKVMPQHTMFSQGNVNMMRASGRDIALPELIKMGGYVGYNYTPKGMNYPLVGNGTVTDFKEMANGKLAYKIENNGNVIWIPEGFITTISGPKQ